VNLKKIWAGVSATLAIFALSAPVTAATVASQFTNLTPERGLGRGTEKYAWSATTFGHDLFVGTYNVNVDYKALPRYARQIAAADAPTLAAADAFRRIWSGSPITPSEGGSIYRYDGTDWTQVYQADPEDVGFRKMVTYDGAIYAGTANGPDGPMPGDDAYRVRPVGDPSNTVVYGPTSGTSLLRSTDGTDWREVGGGPADNRFNASNRAMAVIDDKLYVGTENPITGPELWAYDGADWSLEARLDRPGPDGRLPLAIGEIAEVDGRVVVGTWASGEQGFQLLEVKAGGVDDITPRFSDPSALEGSLGVMELTRFGDQFFVGTLDYGGGFKLVRTANPFEAGVDGWDVVTTDGFGSEYPAQGGSPANAYPWSSAVIEGVYYLGTFNTDGEPGPLQAAAGIDLPLDGRGQIWFSTDGETWRILEDDGFGSPFTYGMRVMLEWENRLVVGTASNLFVPDLSADPYFTPEMSLAHVVEVLGDRGDQQLARMVAAFADMDGGQATLADLSPYIGFEVFASEVVPLPAGVVLLASGLVGLAGYRRLQRRG
jgi:hypothetical protein